MNQIKWTSFIVFTTLLTLVIQLLIINPVIAQAPNTTSAENRNNTKLVVNFKNHTISIVDTITNETISVKPFPEETGNMTTNETLSGSAGNMTTNETLSGSAGNETLPTSAGNITGNETLTTKFKELQGK